MEDNYLKPLDTYAGTLYRETNPDSALSFIKKNRLEDMTQNDVYMANNRDMAMGQGTNKGIILEFDASKLQGRVNTKKPSWEMAYRNNNAEFVARLNDQKAYQDAVKSVTIMPGTKFTKSEKIAFKNSISEWDKTKNSDGSITYTKPEYMKQNHKQIVEQALKDNKPVPTEVLKDYPDLAKQYGVEYSRAKTPGIETNKEFLSSELLNKAHQAAMNDDYEAAYNYAKQAGDKGWEKAYKSLYDSKGGTEIPTPKLGGNVKGKYSDDTITKKEILKRINDIFTTVRTGRIGQRGVEGFMNHGTGIIRSRGYGDLDVISHEVGHLIDAALGLRKNAKAFDSEFTRVVNERFGKGTYEPVQIRCEGIAECLKDYVTSPNVAKKEFPKYYAAFEEALSKNPDVRARVNEYKDMIQAWNKQSPEARGRSGVSYSYENKKSLIERDKEKRISFKEKYIEDKV